MNLLHAIWENKAVLVGVCVGITHFANQAYAKFKAKWPDIKAAFVTISENGGLWGICRSLVLGSTKKPKIENEKQIVK